MKTNSIIQLFVFIIFLFIIGLPMEAMNEFDKNRNDIVKEYTKTTPLKDITATNEDLETNIGDTGEITNNIKEPPPLELVSANISYNMINTPEISCTVKNVSTKTVDAYNVIVYCYNRYDEPVKEYQYGNNEFGGISQRTILPNQTAGENYYWTMYGYEGTAKVKIVLTKVHMTDNSVWNSVKGQEISIWGFSSK